MAGTVITDVINTSSGIQSTNNALLGAAKAWVNFNGTTSPGTIRSSYNVSSATKNGTGDYTLNFTTALADANYAITLTGYQTLTGNVFTGYVHGATYTTSAVRVITANSAFTNTDAQGVLVSVFGNG